jgi:dihydroorotate dehydrogenase (NAD+) catalytic subunit
VADLTTQLCGLTLKNPVLASSGTFGYGLELDSILDLNDLGGFVVKGLSREPIAGNKAPRVTETAAGMLNSIGLQNVGVEIFVQEKLPKLAKLDTAVFANVFGYAPEDYVEVLRALEDAEGLAGYELNVSCPNTKHGGMQFGADPRLLGEVVGMARRAVTRRPLIVKLSPNVTDIAQMARAAEEAGADAISLINTVQAMAVDARARRPKVGAGMGGLSGPAVKPIALRMVYQAAKAVTIPVVGMGGVATGEDVAEFLLCGATAVQVGTASFWDPKSPRRIAQELNRFLDEQSIGSSAELVGRLEMP